MCIRINNARPDALAGQRRDGPGMRSTARIRTVGATKHHGCQGRSKLIGKQGGFGAKLTLGHVGRICVEAPESPSLKCCMRVEVASVAWRRNRLRPRRQTVSGFSTGRHHTLAPSPSPEQQRLLCELATTPDPVAGDVSLIAACIAILCLRRSSLVSSHRTSPGTSLAPAGFTSFGAQVTVRQHERRHESPTTPAFYLSIADPRAAHDNSPCRLPTPSKLSPHPPPFPECTDHIRMNHPHRPPLSSKQAKAPNEHTTRPCGYMATKVSGRRRRAS